MTGGPRIFPVDCRNRAINKKYSKQIDGYFLFHYRFAIITYEIHIIHTKEKEETSISSLGGHHVSHIVVKELLNHALFYVAF